MPVLARLHYVLRGVKRAQGEAGAGRRERLPITPSILRKIRGVWGRTPDESDHIVLSGLFRLLEGRGTDGAERLSFRYVGASCLAVDKPDQGIQNGPFQERDYIVHWSGPFGLGPCVSGPRLLGVSEGQEWPALHILQW